MGQNDQHCLMISDVSRLAIFVSICLSTMEPVSSGIASQTVTIYKDFQPLSW